MKLKTVTEGKTRVVLAAVLALMAQGAWSDERNDAEASDVATTAANEAVKSALRSMDIEIRAYIEALNKRLAQELTREIEALNAAPVELAIAEVPTRG